MQFHFFLTLTRYTAVSGNSSWGVTGWRSRKRQRKKENWGKNVFMTKIKIVRFLERWQRRFPLGSSWRRISGEVPAIWEIRRTKRREKHRKMAERRRQRKEIHERENPPEENPANPPPIRVVVAAVVVVENKRGWRRSD